MLNERCTRDSDTVVNKLSVSEVLDGSVFKPDSKSMCSFPHTPT